MKRIALILAILLFASPAIAGGHCYLEKGAMVGTRASVETAYIYANVYNQSAFIIKALQLVQRGTLAMTKRMYIIVVEKREDVFVRFHIKGHTTPLWTLSVFVHCAY